MSIFTRTENQNSRKDLITETLLDCPFGGQQNTNTQKNCLCRQGKRRTWLQWKCICFGAHILANGAGKQKAAQGMGNSAKSTGGAAAEGSWDVNTGADGSTALSSRDSYIQPTHVELKKFTLI